VSACGGASLRELTPGFYECTSSIDASIPPGLAGNPGWLHGSRPCGDRFQAGPALATEPCWCGRHSIGRCRDCNRPLCGLHGTTAGELLCGECIAARAERRRAREAEAAAAHERSLEARGRDLSANLAECSSARDLLMLLRGREEAVPDADALRSAWTATTGPLQAQKKLHGRFGCLGVYIRMEATTPTTEAPLQQERLLRPDQAAWYLNVRTGWVLRGREDRPLALPLGRPAHPLHAPDARRMAR
jgi:hypothetical protein